MKHFIVASLLSLISACALAQEVHLVAPGSSVQAPLSPAILGERVEAAATKYEQFAPIPRFGVYDVAYPRDLAEYTATGGLGVVLVVVYSQQAAELPLRRLYLRNAGEHAELTLVSAASSAVATSSRVNRVFGQNRWEALYAFPAYLQQAGSELVADFQVNRSGFVLANFQTSGRAQTPGAETSTLTERVVGQSALTSLIAREFPGFVTGAVPKPPDSLKLK